MCIHEIYHDDLDDDGELLASDYEQLTGVFAQSIESVFPAESSQMPIVVPGNSPWTEVCGTMLEAGVGAVLVQLSDGRLGIFTERDAIMKGRSAPSSRPVEMLATSRVKTLPKDAPLGYLFRYFAVDSFRRVPLESHGEVCGMVTASSLLYYLFEHHRRHHVFADPVSQLHIDNNTRQLRKSLIVALDDLDSPPPTVQEVADVMSTLGGAVRLTIDGMLVGIFSEWDYLRMVAHGDSLSVPVAHVMTENVRCVRPKDPLVEAMEIMITNHLGQVPIISEDGDNFGIVARRDPIFEMAEDNAGTIYTLYDHPQDVLCRRGGEG